MPQEFASIPYAGPARARYGWYSKRYMVIHCTSNDASPAAECAFARTRTDGVGLHFASDPSTVLQGLESWYGTGHVGSTVGNRYGISWEFTGFTGWSTSYWQDCIDRAASSMALVMARWNIPHRWLTDAQLRDGVSRGLVTHLQCSRVLGGSTHTDPGPNFPPLYLINALNGGANVALEPIEMLLLQQANERARAGVRGTDSNTPIDLAGTTQTEQNGLVPRLNEIKALVQGISGGVTQEMLNAAVAAALAGVDFEAKTVAALTSPAGRAAIVAAVNEAEDS